MKMIMKPNLSGAFFSRCFFSSFCFVLLISFTSNTLFAQTQDDSKAKEILDRVSEFYQSHKTIETDFSLEIVNEDAQINETQTGQLYIKGDKYKIITEEWIRVSDGFSIWTHFLSDKEVQITEFDPEENELNPASILTIYEKGFKYLYSGQTTVDGQVYEQIDLTPTDPDNPYHKVRLLVNPRTNVINSAEIFSQNGTVMTCKIFNSEFTGALQDELFDYSNSELEEDVEIVDLR